MEYRGFQNKLSAIITTVSLVIVLVGTSIGNFDVNKNSEVKGELTYTQEASEDESIEGIEIVEKESD